MNRILLILAFIFSLGATVNAVDSRQDTIAITLAVSATTLTTLAFITTAGTPIIVSAAVAGVAFDSLNFLRGHYNGTSGQ